MGSSIFEKATKIVLDGLDVILLSEQEVWNLVLLHMEHVLQKQAHLEFHSSRVAALGRGILLHVGGVSSDQILIFVFYLRYDFLII